MSGQPLYRFRRFVVRHERSAMKVGTDSVLLASWLGSSSRPLRVLDVGCGSGVVALLLAQRFEAATVVGVEIDPEAAEEAADNARLSPFAQRVHIICADARTWQPSEPFDLVVCNPPFFGPGLGCPDERRQRARHDDSLSGADLVGVAARMLRPGGQLAVVLPAERRQSFVDEAWKDGLVPVQALSVCSAPGKDVSRALLRFLLTREEQLTLLDEQGRRSPQYHDLTSDFYL